MTVACRIRRADCSSSNSSADSAAKTDARRSPTGEAISKPAFGQSTSTSGVASACSAEEAGGGQERERDEEEARVAALLGRVCR